MLFADVHGVLRKSAHRELIARHNCRTCAAAVRWGIESRRADGRSEALRPEGRPARRRVATSRWSRVRQAEGRRRKRGLRTQPEIDAEARQTE